MNIHPYKIKFPLISYDTFKHEQLVGTVKNFMFYNDIDLDGDGIETVHLSILDDKGVVVYNDSNPVGNFTLPRLYGHNFTAKIHATNALGNSPVRTLSINYTNNEYGKYSAFEDTSVTIYCILI